MTDIEGTTTSLSFVKDVLFPYARARLAEYVATHRTERVLRLVEEARVQAAADDEPGAVTALLGWIDEDRKITCLKDLQGLIWEEGYRQGEYRGHVHEDAVRRLREWHARGISLYVFSSGSVEAQRLLFGNSDSGDLRPLFSGYFDTRVGAKQEPAAYRAIVASTGGAAAQHLYLSDVEAELHAARAAGMQTTLIVRDGQPSGSAHPVARNFDEVVL